MIATVTMNPSIDKTISINNFEIDKVNRKTNTVETAGGKGINVSKAINALGGDTIALGFIGGENGLKIQKYLNYINTDFSFINQNTRVNLKIYDPVNHSTTDINDAGSPINDTSCFYDLKNKLMSYAKSCSFVCFCGSIPSGVSMDYYANIISETGEFSKIALDCEGKLLTTCIKAKPFIIKPNESELVDAFNLKSNNQGILIQYSRKLISDYDIKYVLLSQGSSGSLLITKDNVFKAFLIKDISIKATTGAGDSMLGGFLFSYERFEDELIALRYAAACGTASVMTEASKPFEYKLVNSLLNDIIIKRYNC